MTWRAVSACRLIHRILNPHCLSWMASYDVASNIWQALDGGGDAGAALQLQRHGGMGLHSSTFQLNMSRFLSLTPPTDTECPTKRAYVEQKGGRV